MRTAARRRRIDVAFPREHDIRRQPGPRGWPSTQDAVADLRELSEFAAQYQVVDLRAPLVGFCCRTPGPTNSLTPKGARRAVSRISRTVGRPTERGHAAVQSRRDAATSARLALEDLGRQDFLRLRVLGVGLLRRRGCFPDAGAVTNRRLVDGIPRRPLSCAHGQDDRGCVSGADDDVLRSRRAVEEVPRLQRALLTFDDEQTTLRVTRGSPPGPAPRGTSPSGNRAAGR